MSLALELLDRRHRMNYRESQLCDSSNSNELFAFLQQEFKGEQDNDRDSEIYGTGELIDCYVQRLEDTAKLGQIQYKNQTNTNIKDGVELNILIEKSLLEYELKLAQDGSNNHDKKYIFDINRLQYLLEHENNSNNRVKDDDNDENVDNSNSDIGLLRHYVELLKLGYAPDLNRSGNTGSNVGGSVGINGSIGIGNGNGYNENEDHMNNQLMDELVSTLLSLAVQKNMNLPSVDSTKVKSLDGRINWFKECIYKVADTTNEMNTGSRNNNTEVTKQAHDEGEEKRALKDLQFAHSYLTKKYEEEILQHGQYVNEVVNKNKKCEELLVKTNTELSQATKQIIRLELEKAELQSYLDATRKEMYELQMSNNLLKVDCLGVVPAGKLMSYSNTPPDTPGDISMQLSTPTSTSPSSTTGGESSTSVRILRAEFKKVVEGMNARFAREVNDERRLREVLVGENGREKSEE